MNSTTGTMPGPKKPSSYDAFSTVDSLVSKPVLGSDGAASWQEFQSSNKKSISQGVAPHIPLKRADKLSGMKSIQEERKNEQNIRQDGGDRNMGSGYTVFKRKNDLEEIAERKRRKMIEARKRPENQKYFIKAETFGDWKEDYVFTTRDRGTGYYWDGMDSIKKLNGKDVGGGESILGVGTADDEGAGGAGGADGGIMPEEPKMKKKKKNKDGKKKSKSAATVSAAGEITETDLPIGWTAAIDPSSGNTYYYNVQLNKTVWEKPKPIDEEKDESLLEGWEAAKDPSTGKTYFFNRTLNKTVWERQTK